MSTKIWNCGRCFIKNMLTISILKAIFCIECLTLCGYWAVWIVHILVSTFHIIHDRNSCFLFFIMPRYLSCSIISNYSWCYFLSYALIIQPAFLVVNISIFMVIVEWFTPCQSLTNLSTRRWGLTIEKFFVIYI